MPELPEVETIRRIIGPQITGRSVVPLKIHTVTMASRVTPAEVCLRR
ncbi:MAG: DNA-formamidopyrimidine glycosylase family protein [Ruminococcus sp.]|nr:DNA-formamidopyrimidine glycosylase family protein [Ruminococcus sp.]